MQKLALIAMILAGSLIGLMWPLAKAAPSPESGSAREIVLERSRDGHFYADARVNGHSVRFLIDTGASAVTLTESDAKRAGIAFAEQEFEVLGQGASGMVRGQFSKVAELEIEGMKQPLEKLAVVQGSEVSLLGQPGLRELDEIVIRKDVMILRDSSLL